MPFTAIDEAIAELPDSSKYRAVLRGLWSEDPAWRKAGEDVLRTLSKPYWESTFSRFDAWEKATAEQHASAVLKTLSEWAAKR